MNWLENDVPGGPPVAAKESGAAPRWPWAVLFALLGAGLTAYGWANAPPAKPLAAFWEDLARGAGGLLIIGVLPAALAQSGLLRGLRFSLLLLPLYVLGLLPSIASMTVGWEGGWILGIMGAAAGTAGGAAMGWLFAQWELPETGNRPSERKRAILLPFAFAVVFALYGACNWGIEWVTWGDAWAIAFGWLFLALPGALVGMPLLGLLVMSPFALVPLVPLVASMTVGWEGGWIPGIAGALVGAVAGAVNGWLFNRWIMPEYDKRHARENALQPPGSTPGPGSSGPMAEHS